MWSKNSRLRTRRRKLEKQRISVARKSEVQRDRKILEEWSRINDWEFSSITAEIKHNDSRALLDEAEALDLPTPAPNDANKWLSKDELGTFENWCVLRPESIVELRSAIRKERRERRENVEFWAKTAGAIMAIFTGLVGTVIGLVAVWKK